MADLEGKLRELAEKMGKAGYCNYAACEEYLREAAALGRAEGFGDSLKIVRELPKFEYRVFPFVIGNFVAFLNELGKDGWEVYQIMLTGMDRQIYAKRIVPTDSPEATR